MAVDNLTGFEKEQLIRLLAHHMMPETRQLIARTLPQVFAKLFDVRVTVDTADNMVVIISAKSEAHCSGCGEQWPCSVEKNKGAYRPEISVMHSRKDDTEEFRHGSKFRP